MKLTRIFRVLPGMATAIIAAAGLAGCDHQPSGNPVGTMVCDKSFENIIRDQINVFENRYPKAVIGCQYVTEDEALQRLLDGDDKLAVLGRDLTAGEMKILKVKNKAKNARSMKIAVDAIALIVNKENPVNKLSVKEIERILKGEITSWAQVEPGAPDIPIRVVVDDPKSSMTSYMRKKLMNGGAFGNAVVVTADSISGVFNTVKRNKGAIGVIGVSWLTQNLQEPIPASKRTESLNDSTAIDGAAINERMDNSGVKTLGVMHNSLIAYRPTQENIYSGDYPLTRPIYMVTTSSPTNILGKFYSFVTSADGQRLMMSTGVMPARVQIKVYEIDN